MPSKHVQFRVPQAVYEWLGGSQDANLAAKELVMEAHKRYTNSGKSVGKSVGKRSVGDVGEAVESRESKVARALRALGGEE